MNLARVETGENQTSWRKKIIRIKGRQVVLQEKNETVSISVWERLVQMEPDSAQLHRQSRRRRRRRMKKKQDHQKVESQSQITGPALICLENMTGLEEGEFGGVTSKFTSHFMLARWDNERYRGMRHKERPASISLRGSPSFCLIANTPLLLCTTLSPVH